MSKPLARNASLAWCTVRKAVLSHGRVCGVDFADPVIAPTIMFIAGGWSSLCRHSVRSFNSRRAEFLDVYRDLVRSGLWQEGPSRLRGLDLESFVLVPCRYFAVDSPSVRSKRGSKNKRPGHRLASSAGSNTSEPLESANG